MDLEAHHGLDPSQPAHIWLLHHLFLKSVNQDAQEWANAWDSHKLQMKGQCEHSPHDMFFFGTLQEGPRGMTTLTYPEDEEIDDMASYGIDWEVNDDEAVMTHLLQSNPQDLEEENPFASASTLGKLSEVLCNPPNCPFDDAQVLYLNNCLQEHSDIFSCSMNTHGRVWQQALSICKGLYSLGSEDRKSVV